MASPSLALLATANHCLNLLSRSIAAGAELVEDLGFSFDLQIHIPQMPAAAALAADFPNLQFMLNHAGFPYVTDEDTLEAWRRKQQTMDLTFTD